MKVFGALSLLLPLVSASTPTPHTFTSGRKSNICGHKYNGGYGYGRVEMSTMSAKCRGTKDMDLRCWFDLPVSGGEKPGDFTCEGNSYCIPLRVAPHALPDAGCVILPQPGGVKGSADPDNHACSAGIKIGDDPLWVLSSITADQQLFYDSIRDCAIIQSGTMKTLVNEMPCERTSKILTLQARTTYQACIGTFNKFSNKSVGFTWHLSSPGKVVGRAAGGKKLSEMFEIVNISPSSSLKSAVKIVVAE
ncbi:hypothetical protein BLS_006443 [Venturia inaequalis]|uniref:Uncharacterized protein n=1 Tax=Venturia inaequalis TaxID=5025 RepID=A0A8H3VS02_VENIN|nr:hypothetical protein BLS_006443 [Venturia inaequalis]KAE9985792.1 hypothetical protein EG328_006913 [Venturia inaequalis]KAE9993950.1 hypothetical protein EG327_002284 [Venturia inaequalis]